MNTDKMYGEGSWCVVQTGIGRHYFTGVIRVDGAGALWCEANDGDVTVFGPGMWVRVESDREEST